MRPIVFAAGFFMIILSSHVTAQTTAFNFQGRLNDGTSPANGHYDIRFQLFSTITGGSSLGTVTRPDLILINGVFSTTIDFGPSVFTGGTRFIEIALKPAGSANAYVVLGARQQILSVPYAVRSREAAVADDAIHAIASDIAGSASNADNFGGLTPENYARLNFLNSGNLYTSGNAGFGTATPTTRLTINGGPLWSSNSWTASMNMQNASALGWEANASGQRFGIGQTNGGLHFFRTTSPFGSTSAPAQTDLVIADNGNLTQPQDRNGVAKAMLAVTADGIIVRCYNGVTGSATNNCGFNVVVQQPPLAGFIVNFPFDVYNRFWIATSDRSASGTSPQTTGVEPVGSNGLFVTIHYDGNQTLKPFHLIVF